jgi:hypothetical protein
MVVVRSYLWLYKNYTLLISYFHNLMRVYYMFTYSEVHSSDNTAPFSIRGNKKKSHGSITSKSGISPYVVLPHILSSCLAILFI